MPTIIIAKKFRTDKIKVLHAINHALSTFLLPFGRLPCAELLCDLLFVKAKVFIGVVSLNIGKFANNKQTCFIEMKDGLGSNVPS